MEENKKETQESEQVPAAERIQEPEAVQSQESEPAQTQDQTPKPVRESAGHSRRRQGEDKSQNLRFGVIAAGVVIALAVAAQASPCSAVRREPELQRMGRRQHQSFRRTRHPKSPERRRSKRKKQW